MDKIGVFRALDGTYYTCCCRVKIPNDRTRCPACHQEVISTDTRYEFTCGKEYSAQIGRAYAKYEETKGYARRVTARLKNEPYLAPVVCRHCCEAVDECICCPVRWY